MKNFVEYSHRRVRVFVAIVLVATALTALAYGQTQRDGNTPIMRVQGLEILDSSGQVRITLSVNSRDEPAIVLLGSNGTPRAILALASDNGDPSLVLKDDDGTSRATYSMNSDKRGGLSLLDRKGTVAAEFLVDANGNIRKP